MGALACKTKIILDGGNAAGLAESICEATQNLDGAQVLKLTDEVAYPIIKRIIAAEKSLSEAQDLLLDAVEYGGPRP